MKTSRVISCREADTVFVAIAWLSLLASAAFVLFNRLPGLGYFDGSEYALHIEGGGIAHAPGYPLYILLGKALVTLGADGFLAQQLISSASIVIAGYALYRTWTLEVGRTRAGFAPALAIALLSLGASYYLRLFAILPEVFDLNIALFALVMWAVTHYHYSSDPKSLGWLSLCFGMGLCHHHTLAFAVPGCLFVVLRKWQRISWAKALGYSSAGFAIGCLPLLYLFMDQNRIGVTYYPVRDLNSLLFVLLRKGYGTFQLSPLRNETDLAGLLALTGKALAANYHYIGLLLFAPLVLQAVRARRACWEIPESSHQNADYRWLSPSLLVAVSACLIFFLVFIPNCNLQLNIRSYQTIFLRFVTIPCFLLSYPIFKAALHAWDLTAHWRAASRRQVMAAALLVLGLSAAVNSEALCYHHCDILDHHIKRGFDAIDRYVAPTPTDFDPSRRKCVIFAQGDTLLMGIKYYNHLVAKHPCFVLSPTSLSGQFLDRHELDLASHTLQVERRQLDTGELATHPEALLNLFLKLDQRGYGLFVFSVTDYTEYFGKLIANSPFAYRPVGNILQIVTQTSAAWGMDQMYVAYQAYVDDLQRYLVRLQQARLPSVVVDSQANQALILNLADYAKFGQFYPAPRQQVADLMQRAEVAQKTWLRLFPHE